MFDESTNVFLADGGGKSDEGAPTGHVGTVKFFIVTRGFGFITPDGGGKDLMVHISEVEKAGWKTLQDGQKVRYDRKSGPGGPTAINLRAV